MKVYYDGSDITAYNIQVNYVLNGIDNAQFEIKNLNNAAYDTWKDRYYDEIIIKDGTDVLFIGNIKNIQIKKRSILIKAMGALNRMTWKAITDDQGEMVVLEGESWNAPSDTYLYITSEKEEQPKLLDGTDVDNDEFNDDPLSPKFVIISDATLTDSEHEDNPGYSTSSNYSSGSNSNLTDQDETYYVGYEEIGTEPDEEENVWNRHEFDLGTSIANTSVFQKIRISYVGILDYDLGAGIGGCNLEWEVYWKDGSETHTYQLDQGSEFVDNTTQQTYITVNSGWIEVDTTSKWFSDDGSYWEDGYLYIKVSAVEGTEAIETYVKSDYAKVEITYTTETFEQVNQKISDTNKTILNDEHIYIRCYDDSDVADNYDFNAKGIADGDKVYIVKGLEEALDICFTDVDVNNNLSIDNEGVSQSYKGGMMKYDLFTQLLDISNYIYWVEYSESVATVNGDVESDISGATVTYGPNDDPPDQQPTIEVKNELYKDVIVRYKGGSVKEEADTPPDVPATLVLDADWIYTKTGAQTYAKKKAEEYSTARYAIQYQWQGKPSNMPEVGVKYNLEFNKWNGTDTVDTFTLSDKICRRVSLTYQNGQWNVSAFFGRGNTPADEHLGQTLGRLKRNERIRSAVDQDKSVKATVLNWEGDVTANVPLTASDNDVTLNYGALLELDGSDNLQVNEDAISHDNIADVSENDHHDKATLVSDFGTITGQEFTINEDDITHDNIDGAGTNTHAQIDSHLASTSNPHSVEGSQVSLTDEFANSNNTDVQSVMDDVDQALETHKSDTTTHGTSSNIVGESDTQTLTNKTINADNNSVSNLEHGNEVDNPSSSVHGVTGNIVGTTDSQTLSNKSLGSDLDINGNALIDGTRGYIDISGEYVKCKDSVTDTNDYVITVDQKGEPLGVCYLNASSVIARGQIPPYLITGMEYIDDWDASGGSFPSTSGRESGDFYYCSTGGTINGITYATGDILIYNEKSEGWDYIPDIDNIFVGYKVTANQAFLKNGIIKKLEIRDSYPWEIDHVFKPPFDMDKNNLPSDFNLVEGTNSNYGFTLDIKNEESDGTDSFDRCIFMEADADGGGFRFGGNDLNQSISFCDGWYLCKDSNTDVYVEYSFDDGTNIVKVRFQDNAGNWEYYIEEVGGSTESTQSTSLSTDEWQHLSAKAEVSGGNITIKVYVESSLDYTSSSYTFGSEVTETIHGVVLMNGQSGQWIDTCAIGTNSLDNEYLHLSNYVDTEERAVITDVSTSSEAFTDDDNHLMTAAAIDDRLGSSLSTHTADDDAHHNPYTDSDVESHLSGGTLGSDIKTNGNDIYLDDGGKIIFDYHDSDNIDQIWHDDTNNKFVFVSDGSNEQSGKGSIEVGSGEDEGVRFGNNSLLTDRGNPSTGLYVRNITDDGYKGLNCGDFATAGTATLRDSGFNTVATIDSDGVDSTRLLGHIASTIYSDTRNYVNTGSWEYTDLDQGGGEYDPDNDIAQQTTSDQFRCQEGGTYLFMASVTAIATSSTRSYLKCRITDDGNVIDGARFSVYCRNSANEANGAVSAVATVAANSDIQIQVRAYNDEIYVERSTLTALRLK